MVNAETGKIVQAEAVPSVAPSRNLLPIQMGWADAESFLRKKGYPTVAQAQENPTLLRANDRRCGDYGEDCSSIRPEIVFEYSKQGDSEAPRCITVFDIKPIPWRAIISEFTGGQGSEVPKARGKRPRIRTIRAASGPVDVVTYPEELMVSMGSRCDDELDYAVREPSAASDKSTTGKERKKGAITTAQSGSVPSNADPFERGKPNPPPSAPSEKTHVVPDPFDP